MTSRDSPSSSQVLGGHTDLGLVCTGTLGPVGTVPGHPRYSEDIQTWDLGVHGYTGTSRDSPRSSPVHGGHTDLGLGDGWVQWDQ